MVGYQVSERHLDERLPQSPTRRATIIYYSCVSIFGVILLSSIV